MVKTKKTLVISLFALAFMLLAPTSALACTGVYVGPDASADGTTIIARSNDNQCVWPNYVDIVERVEGKSGRTMGIDHTGTVQAPLPDTTYKYITTPWTDSACAENGLEHDGAICSNEYGVSITMAVTAFASNESLEADPLIENGLTECTADDLVASQSATAREAVELLLSLIDTYGSSESNIALISDQNETWYVEMYTGHQYAAVKLPRDGVSVFGNEFNLVHLSEYEEVITSPNFESLAQEHGFAVFDENDELNVMATYSLSFLPYSHMRTWIGHQIMAPSVYGADYDAEAVYPLVFTPDRKIALTDVFNIMRNRYEGTQYCPDDTGRTDMRPIGTDTAMSVHAAQTYSDLPAEMSVVVWESTAPAVYGLFVPFSNFSTKASDAYSRNQPASDLGKFDTENYAYFLFKQLNTLCVLDAQTYGRPLQEYWCAAEEKMATGMASVLKTASENPDCSTEDLAAYVTDYCISMQEAAFADGQTMLNDINWLMGENSNTMRKGRNPETHELTEEDKPLTKLEPQGDLSKYDAIPELKPTQNANYVPWIVAAVAVIAVAGTAIAVAKKSKKNGRQND